MVSRCLVLFLLLLILGSYGTFCQAENPLKMRPYSGIGVYVIPKAVSGREPQSPIYLYREPGLFRIGSVNVSKLSGNEWIFGSQSEYAPLIVMARKGNWLKVCYDEAGREAWIAPQGRDAFKPWDVFLRGGSFHLLPGLRKQYYQLYSQPDQNPMLDLTADLTLRALKVESDWVMVLLEQKASGWLRWRDEDGRLLVGLE